VKVWDTQTGRETRTLTGHTGRVQSVAFSPDGRRLVSAADDRTVKVWDAQTGQELHTFKGFAGPGDDRDSVREEMGPVAFSPDGRRVASGHSVAVGTAPSRAWTSEVKVWDAHTGREVVTYKGNAGGITSVAFSPDGKRLASAARKAQAAGDGEIKVWDAETGQELHTLPAGGTQVAFSPDGKRLASAARKGPGPAIGEIKVWDAETGQELYTLPAGGFSVAFSPDGKRIAGAGKRPVDAPIGGGPSGSGEVKVWDAETGRELLTLQGHTSDVYNVVFSPDGQRLASVSWFDPTVRVWDAQTGQQLLVLSCWPEGWGIYLAFSRDGHRLVAGGRLWDATPLPEK
jgi:WD40 repeat protein